MNIDTEIILQEILNLSLTVGPKILQAAFLLFAGLYIISWIVRLVEKAFERTNFDESLESFLVSIVSVGLKIVLIVSVAGMLGFETTAFITMLGAMAFAVGMALQGSLGNLAGGVLILIFKPFKLGDRIDAQGEAGTVKSIKIFSTVLRTADNKEVVLPNGDLSNGTIINYSRAGTRRLDLVFGIGYSDDLKKAKDILQEIANNDKRILTDKEPTIVLGNLGADAVEIYCRVWVKSGDYWNVKFDMLEAVKEAFDGNNIGFPYPQRDVHMYTQSNS